MEGKTAWHVEYELRQVCILYTEGRKASVTRQYSRVHVSRCIQDAAAVLPLHSEVS